MKRNLVSPRAKWRQGCPMQQYDRLPDELRHWLAEAALPWSPISALRLWKRSIGETGCPIAARARLARAEAKTLAKEAPMIWGRDHPDHA